MSNLNISTAMATAVEAVLNQDSLTDFTIDLLITNTTNQSYSYSPLYVDKITINQDFGDAFADEIFLEFKAMPADYINMFNNTQGLIVSITFIYVNPQTLQRVFTPVPIVRTYKALLMNPKDILKEYTTGSLMPTTNMPLTEQHISASIPVKLWLIESSAYTIRQQQFHGIFSQATVGNVISYIANQYQIKQIYLVPPDNTMSWSHVIIPPAQNFDELFDYIQTRFGVYMKGMEWYYTNSILYVYPAYENNPVIKYNADIYNVPKGNYAGVLSYHALTTSSNNISIISTTEVKTTDISRPAAEDIGNSTSFMRAATVIDNAVTTIEKGSFINNNRSLTVGTTIDRTASANASNPRYTKTTDNIFVESSKLAKWGAVLIECGWLKAIPFQLYPGHNIKYHYDDNGIFSSQQGILEGVFYTFTKSQKMGMSYTYSGSAHLKIRANSDVTTS